MDDLEARIVATLLSMAREGQSLFTLVHTQVSSRASKAEICKVLRLAGQEVGTRNKATLEQVLESGKQP